MMARQLTYISFILVMLASLALAEPIEHGSLVFNDARVRATLPGAHVTAAYVSITNKGDRPEYLTGAVTRLATHVEIHKMEMDGDVMKMRPLGASLEIPAGQTITLKPGGLHLMLMGLTTAAKKGDTASLTLIFEHAGEIELNVPVVSLGHGH